MVDNYTVDINTLSHDVQIKPTKYHRPPKLSGIQAYVKGHRVV